jgi:hypothetical protein
MEMNKFNKIYNKIVAESESLGRPNPPSRPNFDKAIQTLKQNGYSRMTGRQLELWDDDGYSTYWCKKYSENILFVIAIQGSGYVERPDGGSYATKIVVSECEIAFTKVNKASLFYSDRMCNVDAALIKLNSAFEEIKKEFIGG